jgi:hypothetical protein
MRWGTTSPPPPIPPLQWISQEACDTLERSLTEMKVIADICTEARAIVT